MLRNKFVELGFGKKGKRFFTLPHVTVSYLKNVSINNFGKKLFRNLDQVVAHTKKQNLPLKSLANWDGKIVALFDNKVLFSLTTELDKILCQHRFSGNKKYLEYINSIEEEKGLDLSPKVQWVLGDHMKVLRGIDDNKVAKAKLILNRKLPKIFIFDRLCLIKYGCRNKDIVWSNYFK